MPPRSANRKAKKSTPKSKRQEAGSSIATDETTVKDIENPDISILEPKEEPEAVEIEGFESNVVEMTVKVDEQKIGDIKIEDYLNLNWELENNVEENSHLSEGNVKLAVAEDGLSLNGEVSLNGKHVDTDVIENDPNCKLMEEKENVGVVVEDKLLDCVAGESEFNRNFEVVQEKENGGVVLEDNMNVESVDEIEKDSISGKDDLDCNFKVVAEKGNVDVIAEDSLKLEKGDNLANADILGVESKGEHEGEGDETGNCAPGINRDAENTLVEETPAAHSEDKLALGNGKENTDVNKGNDGEEEGGKSEDCEDNDGEDNEEDEDPSEYIRDHLTNKKTDKNSEIHIGRLDRGATEDDLIEIFEKFGEIQDVRIVRNPTTKKSKGFAFIRYVTVEQAKNALSELKDGVQVRGKQVRISASQDNDTLYMGNICRTWTKEKVLETLKGLGVEKIVEIHLPDDPKNEGKTKGFTFLEFSTHSEAMAAFQRLRKPDAVFGRARSAKVAFTPTAMHPSKEVLSQVKATMARPHSKGRLQMATRGGFKVNKNSREREDTRSPKIEGDTTSEAAEKECVKREQAGTSKMKGHAEGKRVAEKKGKAFLSSKSGRGGKPNKSQNTGITDQGVSMPSKPEKINRKRKNLPSKVDGRGRRDTDRDYSKRPSKKARGKQGKRGNTFKNPGINPQFREGPLYVADSSVYRNLHGPRYAESATSYPRHVYGATSGSKRHHSDMEPHAGFLEPAVGKQGRLHAGYEPAIGTHGQPRVGYTESAVTSRALYVESHLRTQGQPHVGYVAPTIGTRSLPHAGYLSPAVENQVHNSYDYELRRVRAYDGQVSRGSAYAGGSALQSSYNPNYTSYAKYETGDSVGNYYQSSRARQPERPYY